MNLSAPFISRPDRHDLADAWRGAGGARGVFPAAGFAVAAGGFSDDFGAGLLAGRQSPETMATSVATPLERHLGRIADVTEMTSQSTVGNTRITLQFGLDRDIDGAARDVQAASTPRAPICRPALKSNPTYRKVNPADAPIMILALTSRRLRRARFTTPASTVLAQKLSQVQASGR